MSCIREHVDHPCQVFDHLRKIGLKGHAQKCQFTCPEVLYLGHIIPAKGVFPEKVQAVQEFRAPVNVKGVREFLGIAGYYRRFIPNFSKVLHSLTRQDVPFVWTTQCQQAFVKLKELLSSPPVLAYLCFSKPFVLHTDASGQGLGAVLEQEQADGRLHPIAYASQTLSPAESALGILWAAKHFTAYLLRIEPLRQ